MRFEIKSGGITAILVGIAALSGAVFMLGLLAGYDVGRESASSQAQVATTYPLVSPAAAESPASASIPSPAAPVAAQSPSAAPSRVAVDGAGAVAGGGRTRPGGRMASAQDRTDAATGSASTERRASPPAPIAAAPSAPAQRRMAAATAARPVSKPAPRRHPYNIQIQAAMDRGGADEMIRRLQSLGYNAHLTPTQLAGQTWYKVVVGPYATEAEAETAQAVLRARYNSAYGGVGVAAPSSAGAADTDTGD